MGKSVLILLLGGLCLGMVPAWCQEEEVGVTTIFIPPSEAQIIGSGPGGVAVGGAEAVVGTQLKIGDVIEAIDYTVVKLNEQATNVVYMEAGSRLKIIDTFDGTPTGEISNVFLSPDNSASGKISTLIEQLKAGSDFIVQTPTAVIGVRGTKLDVEYDVSTTTTTVAVFEVTAPHSVDITERDSIVTARGIRPLKALFSHLLKGEWLIPSARAATTVEVAEGDKVEVTVVGGEPQTPEVVGSADPAEWAAVEGTITECAQKARAGLFKPVIEVAREPTLPVPTGLEPLEGLTFAIGDDGTENEGLYATYSDAPITATVEKKKGLYASETTFGYYTIDAKGEKTLYQLFKEADDVGAGKSFNVPQGQAFGFYLTAPGRWWARLFGGPKYNTYYSQPIENPDGGYDHAIQDIIEEGATIGFEDQYLGGDEDFKDFVVKIKF